MVDAGPLVVAVRDDDSIERPERPVLPEPDTEMDRATLDDVTEGRGSGIRMESSTAPPKRAISGVQVLSFTITGFDLCQHKLVTA
jgi:hypothetical protein